MARVTVTRVLAPKLGGHTFLDVDAATVGAAIEACTGQFEEFGRFILDDRARLRQHVNVFLNSELIADRAGLSDAVGPNDTIHIIQSVSGG